jgi:lysophospholipase L1-like esterase
MKQYLAYASFILNIVLIVACVYMALYLHVPGKIIRHMCLKKWIGCNDKIVMTGDSLIQVHWKEILKRDDILIVNNRNGEISYINSRLDFIVSIKPEICIITANAYDVYYSGKPKDAFYKYRCFIEKIRQNNIIPIVQLALVATPDKFKLDDFIYNGQSFNELLKKYCIKNNIRWLDVNPLITETHHYKHQYSNRKGVSPNYQGYEVWGRALSKVLSDV